MSSLWKLAVGLLLCGAGVSAVRWSEVPHSQSPSMVSECSSCHAGSAPQTHDREFVRRTHGRPALENQHECLGCHREPERECGDCHRTVQPDWHTPDFCNPGAGTLETREHIRIARAHSDSCSVCHTRTYMKGCVACHRPEEAWLGRPSSAAGASAPRPPLWSSEAPRREGPR